MDLKKINQQKDPGTPENPDEVKTHMTDAWDTLFIGCNFYPEVFNSGVSSATSWNN